MTSSTRCTFYTRFCRSHRLIDISKLSLSPSISPHNRGVHSMITGDYVGNKQTMKGTQFRDNMSQLDHYDHYVMTSETIDLDGVDGTCLCAQFTLFVILSFPLNPFHVVMNYQIFSKEVSFPKMIIKKKIELCSSAPTILF